MAGQYRVDRRSVWSRQQDPDPSHAGASGAVEVSDRQVAFPVRVAYGVGSIADGAKNAAFNAFLVLYYTTVLGLPGTLSGLAIFIALCVDAVTDPLVGSITCESGCKIPSRSAASIIATPMRSLTLLSGWKNSHLANTVP